MSTDGGDTKEERLETHIQMHSQEVDHQHHFHVKELQLHDHINDDLSLSRDSLTHSQTQTMTNTFMKAIEDKQVVTGNPRYVANSFNYIKCMIYIVVFYIKSLGMGRC